MTETTAEVYSEAVDGLYLAAHQPDHWTAAMDGVRQLFDGSRACLLMIDPTTGYRSVPSVGEDEEFDTGGPFELAVNDELHHSWLDLELGQPRRYGEMMDLDAFRQRDLSRIFFRPRDMDNGLVTVFKTGPLTRWSFDISRRRNQPDFEQRHILLARKLALHFLRAREINSALKPNITPRWADFTHAYFVVDPRGKTIDMNAAAEALLARAGSPLRQSARILRATMPEDMARLGELIGACCVPPEDSRSTAGGMMIAAASEDAPVESRLLLSVSPMPHGGWLALQSMRCALVLVRPLQASAQSVIADMTVELFGLTTSQSRLAAGLATGLPIQDVAKTLGITYGSARRYLDEIFRKTATRRQPELVALLKTLEATRHSDH